MSKASVILINVSSPAETVFIKELDVNILSNEDLVVSGVYTFEQISSATSLLDAIQNDKILVKLNGTLQTKANSLAYATPPTTPGAGEVNTASNLGAGAQVFKQKTGVDLEFRSISSSSLNVAQGTNEVEVEADSSLISTQSSVTPASGMEVLLNDSGTLKKGDVSSFLGGGGGGKEPYKRETFTAPLQIGTQFKGETFTYATFTSGSANYAVPFMFQQNVDLNAFRVYLQSGTSTGRFAVYKYNGTNVGINAQFALVYEEATSTLAAGLNTVSLSSSFTFTLGDVYFVIWIPTTSSSLYCMQQVGATASTRWHQNHFFGNLSNYQRYSGGTVSSLALTGGGNAPATIDLEPHREALNSWEYIEIGIENA